MKSILLLLCSVICIGLHAQNYPSLIPYRIKDKWGYSDSTGKLKIKPQFETADFFYNDLAIASLGGKYGLIDKKGKWVIVPTYNGLIRDYNDYIANGYGHNRFKINAKNEKIEETKNENYADLKEKLFNVLKKQIKTVWRLDEYAFVASYDTTYQVIEEFGYHVHMKDVNALNYFLCNKDGKLLSKPSLFPISKLCNQHYLVGTELGSKIVQLKGEILDSITLVSSPEYGLYRIVVNGRWMILDSSKCEFIQLKTEIIQLATFKNDYLLATIQKKDKLVKQLLTRKGEPFSDEYYYIGEYSNGMCVVYDNGLYGYLDERGKLSIELQYTRAFDFKEDLALVEMSGDFFYIDKNGKKVIDVVYDYANAIGQSKRAGKVNISDGDYYGFSNGLALFEENGKYGYINKKGDVVIDGKYDMAEPFRNGYAFVYTKSDSAAWLYDYFLISEMGEVVHSFKYKASIESTGSYANGFNNSSTIVFKHFTVVSDSDGYYVYTNKLKRLTSKKINGVYRDSLPTDKLIRVSLKEVNNTGFISIDGKCYFED